MKLTQKNFDFICETFNHRITKIEANVKWLKWIVGYVAVIMTGLFVNSILNSIL
jgi:hypothetical protein